MIISPSTSWNLLDTIQRETLVYPSLISFPDSQQIINFEDVPFSKEYSVIQRITNFRDIELLTQVAQHLGAEKTTLYIPYLLGARADRVFNQHEVFYLRDVIAKHLNFLGFKKIHIFEPHSDLSTALINNSVVWNGMENLLYCFRSLEGVPEGQGLNLVFPDYSAYKRYGFLETENDTVLVGFKKRNSKGAIEDLKFFGDVPQEGPYVVIDDLCDGGATFIKAAELLPNRERFLLVTHGIFSKGTELLLDKYKKIYTTNSYSDEEFRGVKRQKIV